MQWLLQNLNRLYTWVFFQSAETTQSDCFLGALATESGDLPSSLAKGWICTFSVIWVRALRSSRTMTRRPGHCGWAFARSFLSLPVLWPSASHYTTEKERRLDSVSQWRSRSSGWERPQTSICSSMSVVLYTKPKQKESEAWTCRTCVELQRGQTTNFLTLNKGPSARLFQGCGVGCVRLGCIYF